MSATDHRASGPARDAATAAAAAGVAVAAWAAPATVYVVEWEAGVNRLAFLPPFSRLAVLLGAAALAAGALTVAARRPGARRARRARDIIAPLGLLLLWGVPYLPWLPDRFPGLLLFAGPVRWVVLGVAALGCLMTWRPVRMPLSLPGPAGVFLVSFGVLTAMGLAVTRVTGPGGDEPHYLIIAHSLMADGDLRIENNHLQRDYRDFYRGDLPPHFLRRGIDRVIYSVHAPGLPALVVPAYAIAGYLGARLTVLALAALALVAVVRLAEAVADRRAALLTWAAVGLTAPFTFHGWMLYPEMPATAVTAWGAWWLMAPAPATAAPWLARGAVLATLPWYHTKFTPLLAMLGLCLVIKLRGRLRETLALGAAVVVSLGLWLWMFYALYGVASPFIPYGSARQVDMVLDNLPRGVLGSLVDQEYGLLLHAPIYLLTGVGLAAMLRHPSTRWVAIALAGTAVVFVLSIMRVYMWWGGASAPARFLVPIVPLLAPMLAAAFAHLRTGGRMLWAGPLAISLGICFALVLQPRLIVKTRSGVGALVGEIQGPAPLAEMLPTFLQIEWDRQLPAVAAIVMACVAGWLVARLVSQGAARGARAAYWSGTTGVVTAAVVLSVVGGTVVTQTARREFANRSRNAALLAYDAPRLAPFDYQRGRRLTDREFQQVSRVELADPAAALQAGRPVAGPLPLPPGSYSAEIWFDAAPASEGAIAILYPGSRPASLAEVRGVLGSPVRIDFALPVSSRGLTIEMEPRDLMARVRRIEVAPISLVPRGARAGVLPRAVSAVEGRSGAFVCFLDDNTYPEGRWSWVRGGRTGTMMVVPGGAAGMRLTVQNGAAAGPVTVRVDGRESRRTLSAWEAIELNVPLARGTSYVPVGVTADNGFRPSELDPASADSRWLGARVAVELVESQE